MSNKFKRYIMTMMADNGDKVVFAVKAADEQQAVDKANERFPDHVLCHYREGKSDANA